MEPLFTVANLINAVVLVFGWSIRQELRHISEGIRSAKETANEAHKRIDDILIQIRHS